MPKNFRSVSQLSVNGCFGPVNGLGSAAPSDYDLPMFFRLIILLMVLGASTSDARAVEPLINGQIQVCPALPDEVLPPIRFDRTDCWVSDLYDIDVQGRELWLRVRFNPLPADVPFHGLLLSMKAAAEVFVDRQFLARNGLPGVDHDSELAGRMDVVIPLNQEQLSAASHVVDLKLSSHHNWLQLRYPIHGLRLVDYPSLQDRTLRYYLPSLLPMGVFLLAVFYFGSLTLRSEHRSVPALLTTLSALVMLQLFFEASRGLVAYRYPIQDLRLIGILTCSVGFGLGLVAVLARQFWPQRLWLALGLTAIGMIISSLLTTSMDARTAFVLLAGSTSALALALIGWRRGIARARAYAAALLLFLLVNLLEPEAFVDHGFYLLTAVFLVGLMVLQAMAYSRERRGQIEQRLRADQLQRVLDQAAAERDPPVLSVPGTGSVQAVQVNDVMRIQGAGDYVELHLRDGREILHSATLNELDAELPSHFLRVHRSHLVNTRFIERLLRNEGGTGTLHLSNGQTVPVSRRIMPGVRRALR